MHAPKKPKGKELITAEKQENRRISGIRIKVEHAIGGMKKCRIGHYKIFCVNGNTGFRNESRIFYFIHLQNEEAYERKESSSA